MRQKDLNHLVALGLLRPLEMRRTNARGQYRVKVVYELTAKGRILARETGATKLRRTLSETRAQRLELDRELNRAKRLRLRINLLKAKVK